MDQYMKNASIPVPYEPRMITLIELPRSRVSLEHVLTRYNIF